MKDKNKDTFWVATIAIDLEIGALTCIFGSEKCDPYPVRSVSSTY